MFTPAFCIAVHSSGVMAFAVNGSIAAHATTAAAVFEEACRLRVAKDANQRFRGGKVKTSVSKLRRATIIKIILHRMVYFVHVNFGAILIFDNGRL